MATTSCCHVALPCVSQRYQSNTEYFLFVEYRSEKVTLLPQVTATSVASHTNMWFLLHVLI